MPRDKNINSEKQLTAAESKAIFKTVNKMLIDNACKCVEVALTQKSNGQKYAVQLIDALKRNGYSVAQGIILHLAAMAFRMRI